MNATTTRTPTAGPVPTTHLHGHAAADCEPCRRLAYRNSSFSGARLAVRRRRPTR